MEEDSNYVINLIQNTMQIQDDTAKLIKNAYAIYKTTNHKKWAEQAMGQLLDQELQRKIGLLHSIKQDIENRTSYYDTDKGIRDPLRYQAETEQEIVFIELEHLKQLATILKEEQEKQMVDV